MSPITIRLVTAILALITQLVSYSVYNAVANAVDIISKYTYLYAVNIEGITHDILHYLP